MALLNPATIQNFVDTGNAAPNTAVKGQALEDLICYVFGEVPGISITKRNAMNAFHNEEIDVALWNEQDPAGLPFLSNIVLIECKNWSTAVGSIEVNWFDTKLRNRGLDFGILLCANGITGDQQQLTAAHDTVSKALMEKRRLVVITVDELLAMTETDGLVTLVKEKLCTLAVSGTID